MMKKYRKIILILVLIAIEKTIEGFE